MSIWNKVLLVLIGITALLYVVLVSNRFRLAKEWETKLADQATQIENLEKQISALHADIYPESAEMACEQVWAKRPLQSKLNMIRAQHFGMLWSGCKPSVQGTRDEDNNIRVQLILPEGTFPQTLGEQTTLIGSDIYVFDSGERASQEGDAQEDATALQQQAQFLGCFKMVAYNADAREVLLASSGMFTDKDFQTLNDAAAAESWFAYVGRLPSDSPTLLRQLLVDPTGAGNTFENAAPVEFLTKVVEAYNGVMTTVKGEEISLLDWLTRKPVSLEAYDELAFDGEVTDNETRFPVDYSGFVGFLDDTRVALTLTQTKYGVIHDNLVARICDLKAMIDGEDFTAAELDQFAAETRQQYVEGLAASRGAQNFRSLEAEKNVLESAKAFADKALNAVRDECNKVAQTVDGLKSRNEALATENRRLAVDIARAQFEASERIVEKGRNLAVSQQPDTSSLLLPMSEI